MTNNFFLNQWSQKCTLCEQKTLRYFTRIFIEVQDFCILCQNNDYIKLALSLVSPWLKLTLVAAPKCFLSSFSVPKALFWKSKAYSILWNHMKLTMMPISGDDETKGLNFPICHQRKINQVNDRSEKYPWKNQCHWLMGGYANPPKSLIFMWWPADPQ